MTEEQMLDMLTGRRFVSYMAEQIGIDTTINVLAGLLDTANKMKENKL